MDDSTDAKISRLAKEIMSLARSQLLVNRRFLDAALRLDEI